MKNILSTILFILFVACLSFAGSQQRDAEVALKAATHLELVRGDLESAIRKYKEILRDFPDERPVAAEALVRLGLSYEKLGQSEAKKMFERVVSEYADQLKQAQIARERLDILNRQSTLLSKGPSIRQVWADDPRIDVTGSVSPDGRFLAFTEWDGGNIAVRELVTGATRLLTDSENYSNGFGNGSVFSPDSSKLAYRWFTNTTTQLLVLPIDADPGADEPEVLLSLGEVEGKLGLGGWTPDGKSVLAAMDRGDGTLRISFVSLADGSVRTLRSLGGWASTPDLSLSPDGRYIAYDFPPSQESSTRDIFLLAADASREVTLIKHEADDQLIGWAPDGSSVLFLSDRGGSEGLWKIDIEHGRPAGSAELVQPGLEMITPIGLSKEGSFFYGLNKGRSDIFLGQIEGGKLEGELRRLPSRTEGSNRQAAWSPDGKLLAYISSSKKTWWGTLVVQEVATGSEREINTPRLGFFTFARIFWSPDGKAIAGAGRVADGYKLFRTDVVSGESTVLVEPPPGNLGVYPIGWSPDGRKFFYRLNHRVGERTYRSVMAKNLESGEIRKIISFEGNSIGEGALSPDRRYFAVVRMHEGKEELLCVPLVEGDPNVLFHFDDGDRYGVAWSRDSQAVYFPRGLENGPKELWRVPAAGGDPQPTGFKFEWIRSPVFHPDNGTLAFWGSESKLEVWVMEGFLSDPH